MKRSDSVYWQSFIYFGSTYADGTALPEVASIIVPLQGH